MLILLGDGWCGRIAGRAGAARARQPRRRVLASSATGDFRLEQAAKLAGEIHGDPGVHGPLLVEEALGAAPSQHPLVPDVRVDVEALAAAEGKADESLRRDVIPGKGQGHVERPGLERKEQLPAV